MPQARKPQGAATRVARSLLLPHPNAIRAAPGVNREPCRSLSTGLNTARGHSRRKSPARLRPDAFPQGSDLPILRRERRVPRETIQPAAAQRQGSDPLPLALCNATSRESASLSTPLPIFLKGATLHNPSCYRSRTCAAARPLPPPADNLRPPPSPGPGASCSCLLCPGVPGSSDCPLCDFRPRCGWRRVPRRHPRPAASPPGIHLS